MFDVPKKLRHAGTDSRITIGFRLATLPLHELRGPSGIRKKVFNLRPSVYCRPTG